MHHRDVKIQLGIFQRDRADRNSVGVLIYTVERGFQRAVWSFSDVQHQVQPSYIGVERALPVARNILRMRQTDAQ
jgi:hypothetical protein